MAECEPAGDFEGPRLWGDELRNKRSVASAGEVPEPDSAPVHPRASGTPTRIFHLFCHGATFAAFLVLAGCGKPVSPGNPAEQSAPPQTSNFTLGAGMTRPLRPGEAKVELFRQHAPWLSPDGMWLHVSVILVNHGDVTLSSLGNFPVVIVVRLLDPDGKIVDDRLAEGYLPNPLPPDNSAAIEVKIPASRLAGHDVALLPAQKVVGGFDRWGTELLSLGPFAACNPPGPRGDTLCGDSGDPLLQIADEPSVPGNP